MAKKKRWCCKEGEHSGVKCCERLAKILERDRAKARERMRRRRARSKGEQQKETSQ